MDSIASTSSNSAMSVMFGPCGDQKTTRLAYAGCPDDDNAVAALPDDWLPKRSGPVLANYLKQREQDHLNVHLELIKCAAGVNSDIDAAVRTLAENLLSHINQNQLDMDCIIKKCGLKEEKVTKESRDSALTRIRGLYTQRVSDLASFKREASDLERKRAENLKVILRGHFHRLIAVGHVPPKGILYDFDKRIYEINQQLLSNSRAFAELEAQLRVQLDEAMIIAKSSLNQLTLGVKVFYREVASRSSLRQCKDEDGRPQSGSQNRLSDPTSRFLTDVEEIEASVNRLVQAYRAAILKVFTGFCDKLNNLEKDLYCNRDIRKPSIVTTDLSDFKHLIERPLRRLSSINKDKQASLIDMTGIDLLEMQKSLTSLGQCLHQTFSVLHDSGHLWDAHILRTALVQKLTIAAVEDLLTSHDALELASEIPISIALDQLRCAPDVDKVNQFVTAINLMLDATAEMYLRHSQVELGRLEEFMNLPTLMANTLLSEFKVFLEKYPRTRTSVDQPTSATTSTPINNPSNLRLPLPRTLIQTELQKIALENWKNGFLESFENNISLVPEELHRQAQLWVEERSTPLHMRYSLKMISHSIRKERIQAAAESRISEINYHEHRLKSHLDAVHDLIEHFPAEASGFAAIDAKFLYPLVEWVDRIRDGIFKLLDSDTTDPGNKSLRLVSYGPRLSQIRRSFEESLDRAVAEYTVLLEHHFQEVRISNVRFVSHIKLFSEGGSYAPQEAVKASMALTKAADALESCSNKTFDALNSRRTSLLSQADTQISGVRRILEDHVKLRGRSTVNVEKKKSTMSKK